MFGGLHWGIFSETPYLMIFIKNNNLNLFSIHILSRLIELKQTGLVSSQGCSSQIVKEFQNF